MKELIDAVGVIVIGLRVVVGVVILYTLPVYWLWNWLMPVVFNLPEITVWQALGLTLLANILFKGSTDSKG